MGNRIDITVLISIFEKDNPEWFQQAIDSIIFQTYAASAIIILQDGPLPNRLQQVISLYNEKEINSAYISTIRSKYNVGRGEMLRRGVLACKTSHIAIMDADDVANKNRFQQQADIFSELKVDVVGSWVQEVDPDNGAYISVRKVPQNHIDILKYSKIRNPINQMSVMLRKDAVIRAGNYENLFYFEDYWLWIRMLASGARFHNISECLLKARTGDSMLERRRGFDYAKKELQFYFSVYRVGFISFLEFIGIAIARVPLRMLPKRLVKSLYKSKLLRS